MPHTPLHFGDGGNGNGSTTTTSGSSGPSQAQLLAEKRAMQRLRATFRDVLRRWGISPSKNMMNLIEKGLRGMWSTTMFLDQLRHTPEYRQRFQGIRWKDGMTESQYLSTYAQYQARAKDIGETITKKDFAKLLKRGVTFDEFSDRVDALSAIDTYGPLWNQFKFELESAGINVPGKTLSKSELTKFLMGLGSKQWETVWQRAYMTVNLEKVAGIEVVEQAKGETSSPDAYEITRADLLQILKQTEALSAGMELEKSLAGTDFASLGAKMRQFDMNYLKRYGLTPKDILNMELGGVGAAEIAERAERVLQTQEAFFAERAQKRLPQGLEQGQGVDSDELVQSL